MRVFFEFLLVVAVFPVGPLACCAAAEWLAVRVENSLPPTGNYD